MLNGERGGTGVFTIELTRGSSWQEPAETIDSRECGTHSIEFAAAEALHWLVETQKKAPARRATPLQGGRTQRNCYRRAALTARPNGRVNRLCSGSAATLCHRGGPQPHNQLVRFVA